MELGNLTRAPCILTKNAAYFLELFVMCLVTNEAFDFSSLLAASKRSDELVAAWKVDSTLVCLDLKPVNGNKKGEA
ncbi:hypothetical protein HDU98_004801, partial [Podochytrium sp. JEL0797]